MCCFSFSDPYHFFVNHSGVEIQTLRVCAKILGFSFDMMNPPNLGWGAKVNGSWNGMLGGVTRNDFDFQLSGYMTPIKSRVKYLR